MESVPSGKRNDYDGEPIRVGLCMLTNFVSRYRTTIACAAAAVVILIFAYFELDLIRFGIWFVDIFERHEVDDVIVAIALVIFGLTVDLRRDKKKHLLEIHIQARRVAVLKATMRTVQDLVNNFINSMLLVQLEAGDALSPETLALLQDTTREVSAKLKALGDLDCVPETEMAVGVGIAV
jgi:hypothetical protein